MDEWVERICAALHSCYKPSALIPSLLALASFHQVEYWRARNATLSTLYEQLNVVRVKAMLDVLDLAGVSVWGEKHAYRGVLNMDGG